MQYNKNPRITPAYAGKRLAQKQPFGTSEDHPRVCGEKRASVLKRLKSPGSPPRMRGKELWIAA